jgi:hypothetical protein
MTYLPLLEGEEYFLTTNILTEYGLVNGARVIIKSICTDDETIINCKSQPTYTFKNIPKYLIVAKVCSTPNNKQLKFSGLQDTLIPLFVENKTFYVKPSTYATKTVAIKRTQFPLTPCHAFTSYKAQGTTLDNLIVDLARPQGKIDYAYTYVALSRVRTLDNLFILRPFDTSMLTQKIPDDLQVELTRLKLIEKKTLIDYNNNNNNK